MKNAIESKKNLVEYYENARESFVAKMRAEEDERSNLKFKIAAFVIHELSYSTPEWFKNHFMTYIAKNDSDASVLDAKTISVENAFYDVVADYLIKMESEVEYLKKILTALTNEREKKEFWGPIVFDAFLIVGIYFTPSLELKKTSVSKSAANQKDRHVNPRYLNYDQTKKGSTLSLRFNKNCPTQGLAQ